MARRRSQYSGGGFAPQPMPIPEHPILGPITYLIIVCVAAVAILLGCGPLLDYFSAYLSAMPAGAAGYANPTLQLFSWSYTLLTMLGVVAGIGVFVAVIRHIYYSQYGD